MGVAWHRGTAKSGLPLTDRNSSCCPQGRPRERANAPDKELAGVAEAGFDVENCKCCGSPPGQDAIMQGTS